MSFKISDLKKPNFDSQITKSLAQDGLEITLTIKHDNDFFNALAKVQTQMDKDTTLSKDSLKKGQMAVSEAMLYVIGEYAISAWNVTDMDDTPIAVNGDNFLLVLESVENLSDFLAKLLNTFNAAMSEFAEQVETLKKKSKSYGNGKK